MKAVSTCFMVVITGILACCAVEPALVSMWGADVVCPKFISYGTLSPQEIEVTFTLPVRVAHADVVNPSDGTRRCAATGSDTPSVRLVYSLSERISPAERCVLASTVTDERGNTLSFAIPFTGYNDRVPLLKLNEIRMVYSKPKVEFVEIEVLSAGNMAGVVLANPGNEAHPQWEFPACEVSKGELLVYHFRSIEEGLVNETGGSDSSTSITSSAGIDSSPVARDFWDTCARAPLKKNAIILLRARANGSLIDALPFAETTTSAWPSDAVGAAVAEACQAGLWKGTLPSDAVSSTGSTATRTLNRGSEGWFICPTGKASPGRLNYQPLAGTK